MHNRSAFSEHLLDEAREARGRTYGEWKCRHAVVTSRRPDIPALPFHRRALPAPGSSILPTNPCHPSHPSYAPSMVLPQRQDAQYDDHGQAGDSVVKRI